MIINSTSFQKSKTPHNKRIKQAPLAHTAITVEEATFAYIQMAPVKVRLLYSNSVGGHA